MLWLSYLYSNHQENWLYRTKFTSKITDIVLFIRLFMEHKNSWLYTNREEAWRKGAERPDIEPLQTSLLIMSY